MADETVELNSGSGGKKVAVDTISAVEYQIVKIGHGPDGTQPTHVGVATPLPIGDPMLDIARGLVTGVSHVNKFGTTSNADSGVVTDLWDGANATDDIDIWVAPTAARIHQIVSTSASDDGSPVGVGARTIRIWGLKTWSLAETSEDITMNGTTNVPTANSYVIIHRMEVLTKGATSSNVGVITAIADTDGTLTAQIKVGHGATEMAIHGIPDIQVAYCTAYYASLIKNASATNVELNLVFNPEPDVELLDFIFKNDMGLESVGTSYSRQPFKPYMKLVGPGILKLEGNTDAANTTLSGGFDLILVDN